MSATIGIANAKLGRVRDSHSPRNEECMHNASPAADCTCKRKVTRKPYREPYSDSLPCLCEQKPVKTIWDDGAETCTEPMLICAPLPNNYANTERSSSRPVPAHESWHSGERL